MTLELTAKCNFRCPYCYCVWHERAALAQGELDTPGWKGVIDKCAADGVDDLLFSGGEPLLRGDLFELLRHARCAMPGARLSVFTNASLLDEASLLHFKRSGVRVATSLQGLTAYGAATGTRRGYGRLLATMARSAELEWPMAVSMTITRQNIHEAEDMFAAAALSGAASIQVGPMMAAGRALKHLDLMVSKTEWTRVKERIRALPDVHVPYAFCDEFICTCRADAPSALREKWGDPDRSACPAGKSFGVVGPNGLYRDCLHSFNYEAAAKPIAFRHFRH